MIYSLPPPPQVSFLSGLLLGPDPQVRNWISFFVRNGQKKKNPALSAYRAALLGRTDGITESKNVENEYARPVACSQNIPDLLA